MFTTDDQHAAERNGLPQSARAPAGTCDIALVLAPNQLSGEGRHPYWARPRPQTHSLGGLPFPPTFKVMKCDKQLLPTVTCLQVQDEFNGLGMDGGSGTGDLITLREIRLSSIEDIPLL